MPVPRLCGCERSASRCPKRTRSKHGASPRFGCETRSLRCTPAGNHHGRGRNATWLKAAPGDQAAMVAAAPDCFFVPPYVGPSGWVGIWLDGDRCVGRCRRIRARLLSTDRAQEALCTARRAGSFCRSGRHAAKSTFKPGVTAPASSAFQDQESALVSVIRNRRHRDHQGEGRNRQASLPCWGTSLLWSMNLAEPERDLVVHVKPVADLAEPDDAGIRQGRLQPAVAPDRHDDEPHPAHPDPDEVPRCDAKRRRCPALAAEEPDDRRIDWPLQPAKRRGPAQAARGSSPSKARASRPHRACQTEQTC